MKTRLASTSFIIVTAVVLIVACLLLLTFRRPHPSTVQNNSGAEQAQIKHYHESLDLLLKHTLALQSNLSIENVEQFRSCYTYFLGRSNFPKSWTCVQAKINEINRILESIFDAHMKTCTNLMEDLEKLPSILVHNSTSQNWKAFDNARRKLEKISVKVQSLITLTGFDAKFSVKNTIDSISSQYAEKLSASSPMFADKAQLEQWIKLLPMTFTDKAILKLAKHGARQAFQQQEELILVADGIASTSLDKLKSYTPADSSDMATRLDHFQCALPCLDDHTTSRLSVARKAELDQEMQVAELKYLASEALWAIKRLLENGRHRSFGDLPISYLPEYRLFLEKWSAFPDKPQLEYLLQPLRIHNGKLGQLKIKLCVRELIHCCEVRQSYHGSCWKLCTCLFLQYQWDSTYRNEMEEIGDEFGLEEDLRLARSLGEHELLSTVENLERIQSGPLSQSYCPGPSMADLRQIVMFSSLLPESFHSLLKRIMELRTTLGWGNFDYKLYRSR